MKARDILLIRMEPHPFSMAVGDKRKGSRYKVVCGGEVIGGVFKRSVAIYWSVGAQSNCRWGLRGYRVSWRPSILEGSVWGEQDVLLQNILDYDSRAKAIEALLRIWRANER